MGGNNIFFCLHKDCRLESAVEFITNVKLGTSMYSVCSGR